MMAYTLAWSKRPKSHLKVFKPSTGLTREDIKQCLRSNGFGMMHLDDPFLEAEARKREEVPRQDFFT